MAQRRMFSKTITNSGKFLKMPATSRLLYYDLGMNADDDGYAEWFTVMRMSGASEQDLAVLKSNGLVEVFDENVLVIRDWHENNYIQKDRYTASKYLDVYKLDTKCIQNGYTGKDRIEIGKDRDTGKELPKTPDNINEEAWSEWVKYRKEIKKRMTPRSMSLQWKLLGRYSPTDQAKIIGLSIQNGWTGLFDLKGNRAELPPSSPTKYKNL